MSVEAWPLLLKSVELNGGFKEMIRQGQLDWLPALARAARAITLHETGIGPQEIASRLAATTESIEAIIAATPADSLAAAEGDTATAQSREQAAGRVAQAGYRLLQQREAAGTAARPEGGS